MEEKRTIDDKINEFDEIVDSIQEDTNIENSLEKYKKATKLAKEIKVDLDKLKNEVEVVDKDFSKD